jgi:hypothetical protein
MYEHAVTAVPWMFREKSRRKILNGMMVLRTAATTQASDGINANNNAVVVVDREAVCYVMREDKPALFLQKSMTILYKYSRKCNSSTTTALNPLPWPQYLT